MDVDSSCGSARRKHDERQEHERREKQWTTAPEAKKLADGQGEGGPG